LILLNLTSFPLLIILFAASSCFYFSLGLHKQNIHPSHTPTKSMLCAFHLQ